MPAGRRAGSRQDGLFDDAPRAEFHFREGKELRPVGRIVASRGIVLVTGWH
jgi:hypothetical protein